MNTNLIDDGFCKKLANSKIGHIYILKTNSANFYLRKIEAVVRENSCSRLLDIFAPALKMADYDYDYEMEKVEVL